MQQPWWNGAVIYQLIVRSYADGNGDALETCRVWRAGCRICAGLAWKRSG